MWFNDDELEDFRGCGWRRDDIRRKIGICRFYGAICRIRVVNDSYGKVGRLDMDVYEALHLANVGGNWCRVDVHNGSCLVPGAETQS